MTARLYLEQLERMKLRIEAATESLEEMRLSLMQARAINYDGIRVQTSGGDGMEAINAYIDRALQLQKDLSRYRRRADAITGEILGMEDIRHARCLYLCYVRMLPVKQAARKLHYSTGYTYQLRDAALKGFERKYAGKLKR